MWFDTPDQADHGSIISMKPLKIRGCWCPSFTSMLKYIKIRNDLFLFQVLLSQTREKQAATLSEVTWRGRTVPVKSEPVRLFLLNLQESSKEVEMSEGIDNKISIYESILKQCIDAQQVLRDSLQEDQVSTN